jgi:hypothetical protein
VYLALQTREVTITGQSLRTVLQTCALVFQALAEHFRSLGQSGAVTALPVAAIGQVRRQNGGSPCVFIRIAVGDCVQRKNSSPVSPAGHQPRESATSQRPGQQFSEEPFCHRAICLSKHPPSLDNDAGVLERGHEHRESHLVSIHEPLRNGGLFAVAMRGFSIFDISDSGKQFLSLFCLKEKV